LLWRRVLTSG